MRVAVIGGGTAGYMAAAQMSKTFPEFELFHIYDSRIPTIGVGEGTLPHFPEWLQQITGATFEELKERCFVTKKRSVRFENWGTTQKTFDHDFHAGKYAYHISAANLLPLLGEAIQATHLDKKVVELESYERSATIRFEDGESLTADFVFDARGFPHTLDPETHLRFEEIITNAALIRRGPAVDFNWATRAVARPHGWIFIIPLLSQTSYGYVYSQDVSSREVVQADFDAFLAAEGVQTDGTERALRFPNYAQRQFFDGAVFKIGNAAAFLEPLEATALGIILIELRVAAQWLAGEIIGFNGERRWHPMALRIVNNELLREIRSAALFVGWHYARCSAYDTPFWQQARAAFEQTLANYDDPEVVREFERFTTAAGQFPRHYLSAIKDPVIFEEQLRGRLQHQDAFGGFGEVNFALVGHGIGYYDE